jgi:hypothetical protein
MLNRLKVLAVNHIGLGGRVKFRFESAKALAAQLGRRLPVLRIFDFEMVKEIHCLLYRDIVKEEYAHVEGISPALPFMSSPLKTKFILCAKLGLAIIFNI